MGQIYYDLGFLAEVEVVECSASDLIGQYVGHTGPKTRAQLDKALGKVLFIDEAYRLAEGRFATEAINELVDQLTKPKYMDKLLVILAGYTQEINELISVNPGLSSRFPEEINFNNMSPMQCLEILERTVQQHAIQTPALTDPDSQIHGKMVGFIEEFSALPSWGNARDMKTLAKTLAGFAFKTSASSPDPMAISEEDVYHLTKAMLKERKDRCANLPTVLPLRTAQQAATHSQAPPPPPPPTEGSSTQTNATPGSPNAPPNPPDRQDNNAESGSQTPTPPEPAIARDVGVSDAIWTQLQSDIASAKTEPKPISDDAIRTQEALNTAASEAAHSAALALQRLRDEKAAAEADAAAAERLKQRQEAARAEWEKAKRLLEEAKAERERMRVLAERKRREEVVQEKLRNMGVCIQGFPWVKQNGGYRCAGGAHYIENERLGV